MSAGGAGCFTCLCFLYVVYDEPEQHPRISAAERDYIESCLKGQVHKLEKAVSKRRLIHSQSTFRDNDTSRMIVVLQMLSSVNCIFIVNYH